MGMFDSLTPFSEKFQEGDFFTLEDAKIGPPINTEYGTDTPVQLKIDGAWYSVFGTGLKNQVDRMDKGDLPAKVTMKRVETRSGQKVKLLLTEQQIADDDIPF